MNLSDNKTKSNFNFYSELGAWTCNLRQQFLSEASVESGKGLGVRPMRKSWTYYVLILYSENYNASLRHKRLQGLCDIRRDSLSMVPGM